MITVRVMPSTKLQQVELSWHDPSRLNATALTTPRHDLGELSNTQAPSDSTVTSIWDEGPRKHGQTSNAGR